MNDQIAEIKETKAIIDELISIGYDDKYIAQNLLQAGRINFVTGEQIWTSEIIQELRQSSDLDGIDIPKHTDESIQSESIIVKRYSGSHKKATLAYQKHSKNMIRQGYHPISQSWAPGNYSTGAFMMALLLCLLLIGVFIFIYMILVKPAGILTVTYELRLEENDFSAPNVKGFEKTCPRCAENIKKAAFVCRYCGHEFE